MSDERAFGQLEAKVETLETEVSELRNDVRAIRTMLDQAQGGWKFMMATAGLIGAVAGMFGKLLAGWMGLFK